MIHRIFGAMLFLFFFTNILFAAPGALPPPNLPLAPAATNGAEIGRVAAVKGSVQLNPQGQVGKVVASGDPVYIGDEVSTGDGGSLQILLLDQTVFTIGPNSTLVMDRFVYDPATQDGQVKARVAKGVFRFVTGKIGRKNPDQMEVDLPSGVIGIRGTIVAGDVNPERSLVMLLGPGDRNNTEHRRGRFVLSNAGKSETVSRSGFGSEIRGNGFPSPAFEIPQETLDRINGALSNQRSTLLSSSPGHWQEHGEKNEGASATERSGQDRAGAREEAHRSNLIQRTFQKFEQAVQELSQRKENEAAVRFFSGPTSKNQLQLLALQLAPSIQHFEARNVSLKDNGNLVGTADFYVDINFQSRQIGGGNSRVFVIGSSGSLNGFSGNFSLSNAQNFGAGTENAGYFFNDLPVSTKFADVAVGVDNADGVIAREAHLGILVKNAPGTAGSTLAQGVAIGQRLDGAS